MRSSLARALRASLRHAASRRPPPPQPAPHPQATALQTPISCIQLPSVLALPPSNTPPSTLYELLLSWPRRSSRALPFNAVGDTLVLLRSPISPHSPSIVSALRARSAPHRLLRAAAGMVLADAVARERQLELPNSLFNFHSASSSPSSSSSNGPRRLGIGLIPKPLRKYLAAFFAALVSALTSACIVYAPHSIPYLLISAAICFATRPDMQNFLAWVTKQAPRVAKRKPLLIDRIRVRLAPYIMKVKQPVLYDCGLFSVLTVVDHADYVYVYAGALSRWCLLGWYNVADDYNFDKYLITARNT